MRVMPSVLACLIALAGCAARQVDDPSFAVDYGDAQRTLKAMGDGPSTRPALDRPVIILDGIGSWGIDAAKLARTIRGRADGQVVTVAFPWDGDFDACRRHAVDAVEHAIPGGDAAQTAEVDVIGLSMGGLVARYAAIDRPTLGPRLRVRRLFTISSPLAGARLANAIGWLSPNRLHRDLRPGSAFYERLGPLPTYPVVSYSRLQDPIVGARYASLPGAGVYWLANRPFQNAHSGAFDDPRIVVDLLRRLLNEPPLTADAPSPLPADID